ncbi:hypothetical protein [Streptomyces sp. NPDC057702]|uniref:hypothetical protein n=1 Tax=unclassified Streptomyces TaxID=2593676 RepID=UPI003673674E
MRGTGDGGGRWWRRGRIVLVLSLLAPLLGVTTAARPAAEETVVRAASAETRVAYAGTRHRSLGRVASGTSSPALFGPGPTHFDVDPAALGDRLVFVSRRDERRPQVYLRSPDGSVRRLTSGRDAAHPRLTPDGQAVVFDSAEPGRPGGATQRDLWRVGVDGSALTRLTDTPANEEWPTLSPDGRRLAYTGDGDPLAGRQVHVRPLAGGPARRVTDPADGTASEPVWNPVDDAANREVIAYTATGPQGPRLRWTHGNGGGGGPLLAGKQKDWPTHGAAWLPDGNDLLFLSTTHTCDCEGDWDHVYRVTEHSAATPALVLSEDREVGSATWLGPQEDGGAVVDRTSADRRNRATLQDIRLDGADPRHLGHTLLWEDPTADTETRPGRDPLFQPGEGYDPWTERQTYTPDGRRIAFTRFEGPVKERYQRIWIAEADGTGERLVPLAGRGPRDWDTDPTFSPDGRYLAFTRTSPGEVGGAARGRVLVADAATGEIRDRIIPPAGQTLGDAQPAWSPDGGTLAFTRDHAGYGAEGGKHVWTVPVNSLDRQRDLSATACPEPCRVIDDSPAFSPDGATIAFNRKHGGDQPEERNGLLLAAASGGDCRVLLPASARDLPGACGRELPDTRDTGPFQPRDAAWTADGAHLVFSSRAALPPNSPEKLRVVNLDTGAVTPLTDGLPGRQKEPTVRQSVDLAVRAPDTAPEIVVGRSGTVVVQVLNHGPAASPGTRLTLAPPDGVRVTGLSAPGRACQAASLTCDLGGVPAGATVPVTVTLTGVTPGTHPVDWSVTGAVVDPHPTDNADRTLVPVREAPLPPTPTPPTPTPTAPTPTAPSPTTGPPTTNPPTPQPPTTPPPPKPSPPPPPPPAEPPAPRAGPGVSVAVQPHPGYVGGRVVVTYTVRNGRQALATGLRLRLGLPRGVPNNGPPAGCDATWRCSLPDLAPGARTVLQVVLSPREALTTQVTGVLTTSGTDADPDDNRARRPLRVLQPRIVAVPPIGKPGFVTSVRGRDFPPGVPVRFRWRPGITAAAAPTVPKADGTFIGQLLILHKDQTGPRTITASGPGFSPVRTDFLVVSGSIQPRDEVIRR